MVAQDRERKVQEEYQQELRAVAKDFPGLLDPESDDTQSLNEWDSIFIGKRDAAGNLIERGALSADDARYIAGRPYLRATLAMSLKESPRLQAATSELEATKKELSAAKEKIALLESPEGATKPPASGGETKKERTADDVYADMERMSDTA
jgi:hypothetical protein